ncbi:MAG: hypothetical protein H7070_13510, partial [Saprospiraceae bacterium]|nr:hypothetical protein [Pyrinomonadaceae bacterium]
MAVAAPELFGRCGKLQRFALLFIALIFTSLSLNAQQAEPTPPIDDPEQPIKVKTDLVTLTLTVTDLYGRYVSGLTKNAFTV